MKLPPQNMWNIRGWSGSQAVASSEEVQYDLGGGNRKGGSKESSFGNSVAKGGGWERGETGIVSRWPSST